MSRLPMRTDTDPQPPYYAVSRASAGPPGPAEKVSRICPPKSAGQLNVPSGNLGRPLTTAAILATLTAGAGTEAARGTWSCSLDVTRGALVAGSYWVTTASIRRR
jgi:hypothetical protein